MQRPTQRKAAVAAETKLRAMAVPEVFARTFPAHTFPARTFPAPPTPPRATAPKKKRHLTKLARVAQVVIPDADRPLVKEQPRLRVKKQPRLKRVKTQPRL